LPCLQSPNSALEKLGLQGNNMDDSGVAVMAGLRLKYLNIGDCQSITPAGWRSFFVILQNHEPTLQKLDLSYNSIDDEGAISMADGLARITTLKTLDLSGVDITTRGWQVFSSLLQSPNSALTKRSFYDNNINDAVVIAFSNALVDNTSLERLACDSTRINFNDTITTRGWMALSSLLCNKSSISGTFFSNHTLQSIYAGKIFSADQSNQQTAIARDLASSMQLNRNSNKGEVARQKIIEHHFLNGDSDIRECIDLEPNMGSKLLPFTLAWIGRGTELALLYQLVQVIPALLGSDDKNKVSDANSLQLTKSRCT